MNGPPIYAPGLVYLQLVTNFAFYTQFRIKFSHFLFCILHAALPNSHFCISHFIPGQIIRQLSNLWSLDTSYMWRQCTSLLQTAYMLGRTVPTLFIMCSILWWSTRPFPSSCIAIALFNTWLLAVGCHRLSRNIDQVKSDK